MKMDFLQIGPFFCSQFSRNPYPVDMELFQIVKKYKIRPIPRCNRSSVIQPETLRRIQRRHTNGRHRIQTFLNANSQVIVQMPFMENGLWLAVIGAKQTSSAVLRRHPLQEGS